jgi:hypothetical protein
VRALHASQKQPLSWVERAVLVRKCGELGEISAGAAEAHINELLQRTVLATQPSNQMFASSISPMLAGHAPDWRQRLLVICGAVTGFERGIDYLQDQLGPEVVVRCGFPLSEADRPFGSQTALYNEGDRQRAQALMRHFGEHLEPDAPLGL